MNINYSFIDNWLNVHNSVLEQSFVATIKDLTTEYKKNPKKIRWKFIVLWDVQSKICPIGKKIPSAHNIENLSIR